MPTRKRRRLVPELDWSDMPIHLAIKADWKTPEILIEGSLNCAKTTVWLDKEIDALLKYPGISILLFRWTEDAVSTKLKVAFEELLSIRNVKAEWDAKQKFYTFENGSKAFMFGLKAVSLIEQFNKIRGLGVSRISGDQVEEMSQAVAGELRGRLRPDLTATLRGRSYPFQLTFVANSSDHDFWLSKEFPVDNHIKGRKLYSLSIFDNKYAPQESIDSLIRTYDEDHPKHKTMVLGQRGPNITGVPVYDGLYRKDLHWRKTEVRDGIPILEAFEFGKHSPCFLATQPMHSGGLSILGGVLGEGLVLEDFLPIVKQYRKEWFGDAAKFRTCTAPMGDKLAQTGIRYTSLDILRRHGFQAIYRDNGNAPDVRLALIENIAGYLRRRNSKGDESIAVNTETNRFYIATRDGVRESPFVHHAFFGFTWDPHFTSVSNKEVRQPHEDDKYANVMHALEDIELNFCAGQRSEAEREQQRIKDGENNAGVGTYPEQSPNAWMGY